MIEIETKYIEIDQWLICPNLKMTHDCRIMPSNGFSISGPKQNVGPHLAPVSDFDPVRDLFKNYHRKQNQG